MGKQTENPPAFSGLSGIFVFFLIPVHHLIRFFQYILHALIFRIIIGIPYGNSRKSGFRLPDLFDFPDKFFVQFFHTFEFICQYHTEFIASEPETTSILRIPVSDRRSNPV